jgi:hypothetical protein
MTPATIKDLLALMEKDYCENIERINPNRQPKSTIMKIIRISHIFVTTFGINNLGMNEKASLFTFCKSLIFFKTLLG